MSGPRSLFVVYRYSRRILLEVIVACCSNFLICTKGVFKFGVVIDKNSNSAGEVGFPCVEGIERNLWVSKFCTLLCLPSAFKAYVGAFFRFVVLHYLYCLRISYNLKYMLDSQPLVLCLFRQASHLHERSK